MAQLVSTTGGAKAIEALRARLRGALLDAEFERASEEIRSITSEAAGADAGEPVFA